MSRGPFRLPVARPEARQLACRHQSRCLDVAAKGRSGWPGFSCRDRTGRDCDAFEVMSPGEWRADTERLAALTEVICGRDVGSALRRMNGGES